MEQVVLVTGASSGIGEATVRRLLSAGYTVYAAARRVEKMAPLTAHGARILEMDVTDDASMIAGVDRIFAEQGRLEILVNNAGYGSYGSLEDTPLDEGRRQMEVNLFGLARLTQLVLPAMREARRGKIVNVSSMGGAFGEPLGVWYHTSKYAVEGLSDSLRQELAPFGIDVIVIQPGAICTEWANLAAEGLLERSGATAYAELAKPRARMLAAGGDQAHRSPPRVVADTILRAIEAQRPKTRYPCGQYARLILFARWLLPDRVFDKGMEWMVGKVAREG